jgi:hypothetical protein
MEKIKAYFISHKREAAFGAIIFFAATLSFGLGYEADRRFNGTPIIIEKCSAPDNGTSMVQ